MKSSFVAYQLLNLSSRLQNARKLLGTSIREFFEHLVQIVSISRGELAESRTIGAANQSNATG
jgi:hypothetical protein